MPSTARKKIGSFSRPTLEPMLGGLSALVSLTFKKATDTKARIISKQNEGKAQRQPMLLKRASEARAVNR